jgi:phage gpG-like protein
MAAVVNDKDLGLDAIMKSLKELKGIVVKVGVQGAGAARTTKGVSVVQYATENEFGTSSVPARSFIRSTVDDNKGFKEQIDKAFNDVLNQKDTPYAAMARVGIIARDDIIAKINLTDARWRPLSPKTVKRKKSTKPLIDTGRLKQSITYAFEVKNANGSI